MVFVVYEFILGFMVVWGIRGFLLVFFVVGIGFGFGRGFEVVNLECWSFGVRLGIGWIFWGNGVLGW